MATKKVKNDPVTGRPPRPFTQLDTEQVSNVKIPAKNKKFMAEMNKKAKAKKGGK